MPGREFQVELFEPNFSTRHADFFLGPNDRGLRIRRGRLRRGNEEKDFRVTTRRQFSRVIGVIISPRHCNTNKKKNTFHIQSHLIVI